MSVTIPPQSLKDANDEWVEHIFISLELRDQLVAETIRRIKAKIAATKALLSTPGNEDICAGLYTYALEEYGKVLLLTKDPDAPIIRVKYRKAFRNHLKKFGLLKGQVPASCLELNPAEFGPEYGAEEFNVKVCADLDARLGIFYTDFTDDVNRIRRIPTVNETSLMKAITDFEAFLISRYP